MLLNSSDDAPSDRNSRRERESGRIPINSLLTRTNDADARKSHGHHSASASHHHDSLHRQSSMYVDRRSTSSRAPLPSFASLRQSFHYADQTSGDTDYRGERQSHRRTNHSSPHSHRNELVPSSSRPASNSKKGTSSVGGGGKPLTRTKSVPYVSSDPQKESSSINAPNDPSNSVVKNVAPSSPSSASSSQTFSPNPPRRRWKPWEDQLLIQIVSEQGPQRWNTIAQGFPGRNGRQVRLRWMNHLQPSLDKRLWRAEEDAILLAAHKELGNKWALIATRLHGRTDNSVKNRYKSIARRAARSATQPMDK